MIWFFLGFVAVVYLLVMVVMYFMQSGMVYFPSRTIDITPQHAGLDFEDITLRTDDGIDIHGWFIPAENPRGTLLFCHGNAGNISHRLESILQFHNLGLSVFIFDYHGYGQSGGKPGEEATYMDAKAAWHFLTGSRGIDPDSIIVFGRSLGGAVALWLAARHTPKAVIVESAFSSIPDIAAHYYRFLPVRLLARFDYDSKANIANITVPVMIIHSPDDDIIPYSHGQKLFDLANEPKQFLSISGSHNDGHMVSGPKYTNGLDSFLTECLER